MRRGVFEEEGLGRANNRKPIVSLQVVLDLEVKPQSESESCH